MTIQLLVEHLNQDKSLGYTKNGLMMLENAKKIKITNIKNTEDVYGLIFKAGRYVAAVLIDTDGEYVMMFFDLKKNKALAETTCKKLLRNEAATLFMKNFEEMNYPAAS